VAPGSSDVELRTLLEESTPRLRVYPRETVVGEKLEAIASLRMANTGRPTDNGLIGSFNDWLRDEFRRGAGRKANRRCQVHCALRLPV
jgi:hypothetical protein